MKEATVRDFRLHTTKFLGVSEEVVVTRYGRPVAVLTPVKKDSPGSLLLSLQRLLKNSGISKRAALKALAEARREVYGS